MNRDFKMPIAGADRAIVVTTPEVSAIRDADRIIGLLEARRIQNGLILSINRLRMDMVRRGDMMSVEDVVEILAVNLIGAVPDDETVVLLLRIMESRFPQKDRRPDRHLTTSAGGLPGEAVPLTGSEQKQWLF